MTRNEYNEVRAIEKSVRECPPTYGCTCTIRTDASPDYKIRLDRFYRSFNMHPASVRVDRSFYDDKERIVYLYGANDVILGYDGRTYDWRILYTKEEHERFAEALTK